MTSRLGTMISATRARLDDGGFRRLADSLDRGVSLARTLRRHLLGSADGGPLGAATAYIIFPSSPKSRPGVPLAGCALTLAERIRELASRVCGGGGRVRFLCADPQTGLLRTFEDGRVLTLPELFSGHPTVLLANTSFLLNALPPVAALLREARGGALAVCAADSSRSLYAVAVTRQAATQVDLKLVIRHLASCGETPDAPRWADRPHVKLVRPPCGSSENSPAAEGLKNRISRRSPIAPTYLNAALAELFYEPADTGPTDNSLERLRQAFLAQRERSSVPWIFNMLVNEIEYRLGLPTLDSLPPEIHLSLTGRCNIECKFCHYAHERAYSDYVSVERIAALDALRYSHTLRLSSGIGEPTINPHLAAIVEYVAGRFPQVQMNFFTNGTALNRRGLTDALVYNTTWINVSLNAATRSTWQELCEKDMFDRLCSNLKELHRAKRERGAVQPVVYGSMVLTARNVHDLPRMPELCRSLGIDRFTGIPFFSLDYDYPDRYGAAETFHRCREVYDRLYEETLREAQTHRVSIELPLPASRKQVTFGLELRAFHDFAGTEETPGRLGALVGDAEWPPAETDNCHHLWRTAYIGSTDHSHALPSAHYLYPCLGPLARVDFSTRTTFDFPDTQGFRRTWNSPVLVKLRAAQTQAGLSRVCDACRRTDSRDPENFEQMQELLKDWREVDTAPLVQLTRKRSAV
jgi:sulfatase maturation enzyme AslB (radical SAM superfamily)